MSTGKQIDFSHWPKGDAPASEGRAVPYLDIAGKFTFREPVINEFIGSDFFDFIDFMDAMDL